MTTNPLKLKSNADLPAGTESDVQPVEYTRSPIKLEIPPYGIVIGESHHHSGFVMKPMRNDYTKIYFILDGVADCVVNSFQVRLEPGHLFLIPSGFVHHLQDKELSPLSLYILAIEHSSMKALPTFRQQLAKLEHFADTHKRPFSHHDYAAYEIPRMIRKILYEQRVQSDGYVPAIQATLLNMVVAINRVYGNIPTTDLRASENSTAARIRKTADYMASNFFEAITVEHMAKMACLSVRQFTNQFKAVHGVTFMQYMHFQRVKFAKKLLAETDQQIVSICFECGFNDLAHFYRVFKKLANQSPRRYRLNARAGTPEAEESHQKPARASM